MQIYRDSQKDFKVWLWEPRGRDEVNTDEEDDDFNDEGPERELAPLIDGAEDGKDKFKRNMDLTTMEERPPKPMSTNVDGFWNTNRVRYTLERATEQGMKAKVGILAWRHLIKAIMRAFTQDPRVLQMFEDDGGEGEKSDDEVRDWQFGHSPWVAGMVYGRGIQEYPGQTAHQRKAFRRVSMEWHRFLGFPGVLNITGHGRAVPCATLHVSSEA